MSKYIQEEFERLEKMKVRCEDYSNQNFYDLNRQITLFVAILLPLSGLLLVNKELISSLDFFEKYLIAVYLISITLSALLGSIQFVIEDKFWEKRSNGIQGAINKIIKRDGFTSDNENIRLTEIYNEDINSLPRHSSDNCMKFSYLFLFIGLFCLVLFMLLMLYSF